MISTFSLIAFLLRLTLSLQGQLGAVFLVENSQDQVCIHLDSHDQGLRPIIQDQSSHHNALLETEVEEKNETESEETIEFDGLSEKDQAPHVGQSRIDQFFGPKPLSVNRYLYDLFHSWKIYLS